MAQHVCSFVGVAAAVAALVSLIMHCEHHQAIITLKRHVKYLKFQLLQALSSKVQLLHLHNDTPKSACIPSMSQQGFLSSCAQQDNVHLTQLCLQRLC